MSMTRKIPLLLVLLVSGNLFATPSDERVQLSSGSKQVALIELFTSEGCSSCPPADRWMSKLKADPDLWSEFTPIAFHVDYWDYIGWSDRFAQARFGDRQRRYAAEGAVGVVYTPGLFHNGSEWRGWRKNEAIAGEDREVGELNLLVGGTDVSARFDAIQDNHGKLTLHVAVLGMDLETKVSAGENSARTLQHDFVALGVVTVQLNKTGSSYSAVTPLPEISSAPLEQAIVAWVSTGDRQAPIQSVGGFLLSR